jgi:type IV pilus assembly protein PilO
MRFGLREFIFLLLLLAVPVAAFFFVFKPRNEQIQQTKQDVMQRQEKLKQLQVVTAQRGVADLGREIDDLAQAIKIFEKRLPAQREVEVILSEVTKIAGVHHLTIRQIRPDKMISTANCAEQPIRMTITGEFEGFYGFLTDVERLPRITQLPHLTLKKVENTGKEQAGPTLLEANLTLSIFFDTADEGSGKERS